MDGKPPTYDDLLDLTRWQARQIDKLRADVERLLDHDEVGATNSLAEREGRPAVIARKLSTGNRTEAEAETHAVLASVVRTYRYQGRDSLRRWPNCSSSVRDTSWSSTIPHRRFRPYEGPDQSVR
jgi:hypothetical protein